MLPIRCDGKSAACEREKPMRRAERLYRLVNEMRTRGVSRADDLATGLEVSVRTIYRDIAHLQASGLPIEGAAGVGYLLRPGFDLPNVTFTHDQVDALAIGLSFVERMGDPVLAAAAREARAMLQAAMPRPETRILADAPYFTLRRRKGDAAHVGLLRTAIRKRQVVALAYTDGKGQRATRRVRPLAIWTLTDGWMFSGWCELRGDFRTFRCDRIADMAATGDIFDDAPDKSLQAFMAAEQCDTPGA
jgi:predicted DNA-binding transcriptional regulator YafY